MKGTITNMKLTPQQKARALAIDNGRKAARETFEKELAQADADKKAKGQATTQARRAADMEEAGRIYETVFRDAYERELAKLREAKDTT